MNYTTANLPPEYRARVLMQECGAEMALEIARVFEARGKWRGVKDAILDRMDARGVC